MTKIIFSQDIQKQYLTMHDLVVKAKFYFLKAIQSVSLTNDDKNILREKIMEISTNMNRQFTAIRYAKITPYNKDEYEFNENEFIKKTKHYLENLVKIVSKKSLEIRNMVRMLLMKSRLGDGRVIRGFVYEKKWGGVIVTN